MRLEVNAILKGDPRELPLPLCHVRVQQRAIQDQASGNHQRPNLLAP